MAWRTLTLIPLLALAGCKTTDRAAALSAARQAEAVASVKIDLPNLPGTCTAKVGRVRPAPTEPRVVTIKRWEVVADARDRQSDDCAAWWAAYKAALNGEEGRP